MTILIKNREEIKKIRKACKIAGKVLEAIQDKIAPGIDTESLDEFAEKMILKFKAYPAFKGYRGYPKTICASINNEVVHGIPSRDRILKSGDIISIDLGVRFKGYYGDVAATFGVGKISLLAKKLIETTRNSLYIGISKAQAGNKLGDISSAIENYVNQHGFSVVRRFVGHGIGKQLHEEPEIPNFGFPGEGPELKNGMVLAIEPMVNAGSYEVEILKDGWTAITKDGKLSAHFEHTILISGEQPEILTEFNYG
ncbi:MAG TPA: type I methionyl aminopeptidase [Candidatus Omnitrophica bacterium]|nr:type I methionyl aminopeptidase [Candidatus Omnitrophota bacterium]